MPSVEPSGMMLSGMRSAEPGMVSVDESGTSGIFEPVRPPMMSVMIFALATPTALDMARAVVAASAATLVVFFINGGSSRIHWTTVSPDT